MLYTTQKSAIKKATFDKKLLFGATKQQGEKKRKNI